MELQNLRGRQNSITDALQLTLPEHAVISVVGAGGKTSLVFAWARELAAAGKSDHNDHDPHVPSGGNGGRRHKGDRG